MITAVAASMQTKFLEMRGRLSDFYAFVKAGHEAHTDTNRGHDLRHDSTVAQYTLLIAPDPRKAEKAWVAAFCHSMDYWKRRDMEAFKSFVEEALSKLPVEHFTINEIDEMRQAALRHGEKNGPNQSLTQQVLQDADRLAILMVAILFQIGQGYQKLPVLQLEFLSENNPASTYDEPCSCIDDLRNCISEFVPQFRLPNAIEMVQEKVSRLNHIIGLIQLEHMEIGLDNLSL